MMQFLTRAAKCIITSTKTQEIKQAFLGAALYPRFEVDNPETQRC